MFVFLGCADFGSDCLTCNTVTCLQCVDGAYFNGVLESCEGTQTIMLTDIYYLLAMIKCHQIQYNF